MLSKLRGGYGETKSQFANLHAVRYHPYGQKIRKYIWGIQEITNTITSIITSIIKSIIKSIIRSFTKSI